MERLTLINATEAPIKIPTVVGQKKQITLEIFGTASSATVNFLCRAISGAEYPIMGVRLSDLATGTSGGLKEVWRFDVSGLSAFIVDLKTLTGGNVSVIGDW